MKISVERRWFSEISTIGEMSCDGEFFCFTLEPPVKHDGSKPRAIPEGTYVITLRESSRFERVMPHVENVPDFSGILIHCGNEAKDTEGCLLVGRSRGENFIGSSKIAYSLLWDKFEASNTPNVIRYFSREE